MKKSLKTSVKILLSGALLFFLFWELDWRFVKGELTDLRFEFMFSFLFFQLLAMGISAKKWQSIAKAQNIRFSVESGFRAYLTGTFVNNFLPSTIGGDIYRALWLTGRGEAKAGSFSSVIFDRVNGLLVTLGLALVTSVFVWQYVRPFPFFLSVSYTLVFLALCVFFALAFFVPRQFWSVLKWPKLESFAREVARYRDPRVWAEACLWSSLFVFFGLGVSNYLLFLALGYTLPFLPFFGLVVLMALYVSFPISINNIGVKEWAYGVLFVLLGVSFEAAVTVALISRVLQTGLSLLALPAYFLEKKKITLLAEPLPADTLSRSEKGGR